MPYDDLTGTIVKKICMACNREFGGVTAHCPHDGNLLIALPQDQWEGHRLADRYKIDRRLGTGGMGVVYLAWHELMERWVAIKMLKASFIEDRQSVMRFQQEAKAASRLKHPNIISLYEFDVVPQTGQPYMVMDYLVSTHPDPRVQARSVAQEIKELGQLPVERCIQIIGQACEGLDHAHRQGVIHRDVKPANIMIVPNEQDPYLVKVVDFGVAKLLPINSGIPEQQMLTQVGEICGSPVYMSPEQCMGQSLDSRADIYSMGVVLYECLTGRLPLVGRNMVETMAKHQNDKPPSFREVRPDLFIPDRVEQVVMRALAKQPHERPQTMSELAQDLQFSIPRPGQTPSLRAHELLPLETRDDSAPAWVAPAAVAGVVVILAAVGFFAFNSHPAATPPQPPSQALVQPTIAPVPSTAPPAAIQSGSIPPQPTPQAGIQNNTVPSQSTPPATISTTGPSTLSPATAPTTLPAAAVLPSAPTRQKNAPPPAVKHHQVAHHVGVEKPIAIVKPQSDVFKDLVKLKSHPKDE